MYADGAVVAMCGCDEKLSLCIDASVGVEEGELAHTARNVVALKREGVP